MMIKVLQLLIVLWGISIVAMAQPLPVSTPEQAGLDAGHLQRVDEVIEEAIADRITPGAALMVIRDGVVAYRQFYGHLSYDAGSARVDERTVYDLASLTKPMATTMAIMLLVERGKISLTDAVFDHIEGFDPQRVSEDDNVTMRIKHLLTHTAGFPPIITAEQVEKKYGEADRENFLKYINEVRLRGEVGESFIYSDIGFITLQTILENVTGMTLHEYTAEHIFEPLKMNHTTFLPEYTEHIAPTEKIDGEYLTGIVHDPRAREIMGGVAGHAGLFSNLNDIGRFALMMLNEGEYDGQRILSPAGVSKISQMPYGMDEFGRALGWDMHSAFSTSQGDLASDTTYGHTGYTGPSIHIDPEADLAVILLTNRVHPDDSASVVRLRRYVSNIVGASVR